MSRPLLRPFPAASFLSVARRADILHELGSCRTSLPPLSPYCGAERGARTGRHVCTEGGGGQHEVAKGSFL